MTCGGVARHGIGCALGRCGDAGMRRVVWVLVTGLLARQLTLALVLGSTGVRCARPELLVACLAARMLQRLAVVKGSLLAAGLATQT